MSEHDAEEKFQRYSCEVWLDNGVNTRVSLKLSAIIKCLLCKLWDFLLFVDLTRLQVVYCHFKKDALVFHEIFIITENCEYRNRNTQTETFASYHSPCDLKKRGGNKTICELHAFKAQGKQFWGFPRRSPCFSEKHLLSY